MGGIYVPPTHCCVQQKQRAHGKEASMLNVIFSPLHEDERIKVHVWDLQGTLLETLSLSLADVDDVVVAGREYSFALAPETNEPLNVRALQIELPYVNVHEKAEALRALRNIVIPPTFIVDALLSFQTYWMVTERVSSDTARELTELLRAELDAPVLTTKHIIPGSQVVGAPTDTTAKLVRNKSELSFTHTDLRALLHLSSEDKHKLNTTPEGGNAELQSWSLSLTLRNLGVSNEGIKALFSEKAVGGRSIKKLLDKGAGDSIKLARVYMEKDDCYFVSRRAGSELVSTFVFEPLLLLEGLTEDTFIGNVRSQGETWQNVRLPKSAFQSVSALSSKLGRAAWAWLGTDKDVRFLLPHITAQWELLGGERSLATGVIGRHGNLWVSSDTVLDQDGTLNMYNSGVLYVDSGRVKPEVTFAYVPSDDELVDMLKLLAANLPNLNVPVVLWPMLGWFMATPYKTLLKTLHVPFPHLAVYGSTGAGKTSTIEGVLMPLVGYKDPARSHDCDTTSYALMALMASTNAVPVSLAEFRQSLLGVAAFKSLRRMLLLAYDAAGDTRGTREQHTIEYDYTAPIVLSGEDVVSDRAIRRRTIIIGMNHLTVKEAAHQEAFANVTGLHLNFFAPRYIQYTLEQRLTDVEILFNVCYDEIGVALPTITDDRVRRNCAVVLLGVKSFQGFLDRHGVALTVPSANFLDPALSEIENVALHRGYLIVDEFIVDIINEVSTATDDFPYKITNDGRLLWIQLRRAYDWWRKFRLQRQQEVFSYRALSMELRELRREVTSPDSYILNPKNMSILGTTYRVYGFDVLKCHEVGFDVPDSLGSKKVIVHLKGR